MRGTGEHHASAAQQPIRADWLRRPTGPFGHQHHLFTKESRNQRMATKKLEWQGPKPKKSVMKWLLDSDPSIRWHVMRDLTEEPDEVVGAERSRVASEGWGARLLDLQGPDGRWGDGTSTPKWESTLYTL
jgi:hypothetical protein